MFYCLRRCEPIIPKYNRLSICGNIHRCSSRNNRQFPASPCRIIAITSGTHFWIRCSSNFKYYQPCWTKSVRTCSSTLFSFSSWFRINSRGSAFVADVYGQICWFTPLYHFRMLWLWNFNPHRKMWVASIRRRRNSHLTLSSWCRERCRYLRSWKRVHDYVNSAN